LSAGAPIHCYSFSFRRLGNIETNQSLIGFFKHLPWCRHSHSSCYVVVDLLTKILQKLFLFWKLKIWRCLKLILIRTLSLGCNLTWAFFLLNIEGYFWRLNVEFDSSRWAIIKPNYRLSRNVIRCKQSYDSARILCQQSPLSLIYKIMTEMGLQFFR
jgi:hypothetical protein